MSKIVYILREQFPDEDCVTYGVTSKKSIAELWEKRDYCSYLKTTLNDPELYKLTSTTFWDSDRIALIVFILLIFLPSLIFPIITAIQQFI